MNSYADAMARVDALLTARADDDARLDNLTSLLTDAGKLTTRLTRELAQAHAEIRVLNTALHDRNELLDVLQEQVDQLHRLKGRTTP